MANGPNIFQMLLVSLKSTAAILAAAMFVGIVRRLQLRWLARPLWCKMPSTLCHIMTVQLCYVLPVCGWRYFHIIVGHMARGGSKGSREGTTPSQRSGSTGPQCEIFGDCNMARQLYMYKNISMLFLFPVKTVSLVQASIHNVSYIVPVSK